MVRSRLTYAALAAALSLTLVEGRPAVVTAQAPPTATVDRSYLNLLRWRSIGPSRGGRVVAVAGDPVNKFTFYQGTTGGGVWKGLSPAARPAQTSCGRPASGGSARRPRPRFYPA